MSKVKHQWQKISPDIFCISGPTERRLDPGFYRFSNSMAYGLHARKLDLKQDNLLVMPDSPCQEIVDEINSFWGSEEMYNQLGFDWKRGIILHGDPGVGKTAITRLLSQILIENHNGIVCALTPETLDVSMDILKHAKKTNPDSKFIFIIEDIDSYLRRCEETLLDILDGNQAKIAPGTIFIATTNHLHSLPPRIRNRPSRFDRVIKIEPHTAANRRVYFKTFNLNSKQITALTKHSDGMNFAQMKEMIILTQIQKKHYEDAYKQVMSFQGYEERK